MQVLKDHARFTVERRNIDGEKPALTDNDDPSSEPTFFTGSINAVDEPDSGIKS